MTQLTPDQYEEIIRNDAELMKSTGAGWVHRAEERLGITHESIMLSPSHYERQLMWYIREHRLSCEKILAKVKLTDGLEY